MFCTLQHFQGSQTVVWIVGNSTNVLYPTAFSRFSNSLHSLGQKRGCFVPYSIFKVLKQGKLRAMDRASFVPYSIFKVLKPPKNLNAYSTPNKPSCFLSTKPYSYELYHTKTFWSISVSYKYSELHFSKKSPRPPIPFC